MLEYELKDFLISSDEWKIIEELYRVFKVKFILFYTFKYFYYTYK